MIADYYKTNGLPEPYDETARRKIVPETLERRVLAVAGHDRIPGGEVWFGPPTFIV